MNKEYKVEKEYSVAEIIRYNLRMWWLAVIFAVVCAVVLGGYKYKSNLPYVERELYADIKQVAASLYVKAYNQGTSVERVGTMMKIADSNRTYDKFIEITGYPLEYEGYKALFDPMMGEVSDVLAIYVNYPANYNDFVLADDVAAKEFAQGVIDAVSVVSKEMTGAECISVLDAPYATSMIQKLEDYSITEEDFRKGIMKGLIAGLLLGIIVEVVVYTFWMLLYKKPKNAEEIRQCLDAPVIDSLKNSASDEDAFKKVALFLKDTEAEQKDSCMKISCVTVQCQKKDAALKLAMSYANEQKKTLFVNLAADDGNAKAENSISSYILGGKEQPKPLALNAYLDTVCRSRGTEKGLDIAGNRKFEEYLKEASGTYECIIINSEDALKCADAYAASKLCDKTFVVCGRKTVKNETLYRVKNTADVNDIHIEGVLVYEL